MKEKPTGNYLPPSAAKARMNLSSMACYGWAEKEMINNNWFKNLDEFSALYPVQNPSL